MLFQLTDVEYAILDSLADGAQTLIVLMRELRRRKQPWDPATVMASFIRLVEKQLIRCGAMPGSPVAVTLSQEQLRSHVAHFPTKQEPLYWVELTDGGKQVWENWQQAA